MTIPSGLKIVDTMIGAPVPMVSGGAPLLMDRESREVFTKTPAEYLFGKSKPPLDDKTDPIETLVSEMDKHNIAVGMLSINNHFPNFALGYSTPDEHSLRALREHPDRFIGSYAIDPNLGMEGVYALQRAVQEQGVRAAWVFPAMMAPQTPPNDKKFYPLWAKCVELDIPVFVSVGIPGPRVPYETQFPGHLDEVCWFFPELKIVMRHGGEPWADLCVKLMLKWPNLYYSTSAFAPKHLPQEVIQYMNTRGANKVIYAGYYPSGLSLDRIFSELDELPLREHVWAKFLGENAARVLKLTL